MSTLAPLQTVYRGYLFRSRLEARWAVFFDALHVRWEYEPEGYDLGPAGWYLPDFRLPDMVLAPFVEIKGRASTETEQNRASALSELSGSPVLLVVGDPLEFDARFYDKGIEPIQSAIWKFGHAGTCQEYDKVDIVFQPRADPDWQWCPRVRDAATTARQARFEHEHRENRPLQSSWSRRLKGWATKKYGEDWAYYPGYEVAEEEFRRWLELHGESS